MKEPVDLVTVERQRDKLAKFIFREDSGALDSICCLPEMNAGRCPYRTPPYGDKDERVCISCVIRVLCGPTATDDALYE